MEVPKNKKEQYRKDLEETRARIKGIEEEMADELEKTRKRLRELLEEKKAMVKIYESLAALLGIESEFKEGGKGAKPEPEK